MSTTPETLSRRDCLKRGLSSLVAIPIGLAAASLSAVAAGHTGPKLSESDPTAQALGYVHDATKADINKFPKRAGADGATQFCSTCRFFEAEADAEWGPCQIVGQKWVRGQGWCNGWIAKAS
jgi:hypothetical protein